MVSEEMPSHWWECWALWSSVATDPQGRMGTRKLGGGPSSSLPRENRWLPRAQVGSETVTCQWKHEEEESRCWLGAWIPLHWDWAGVH